MREWIAMKVIVTGFTPFGGEKINPSYEAVKTLPDTIQGAEIIKAQLPTVFGKAPQVLKSLVQTHQPRVVISVGQAGGRSSICVERVAVNLRDSRSVDNEGNCPQDEAIIPQGENAYFSNLPTRTIVQNILNHGIPAALSYSAGTYVCNDVMYNILSWRKQYPDMLGGFIHVPYSTTQAAAIYSPQPSMPIATIGEGLRLAIEAVLNSI